jgi:hypothetical protein
MYYFECPHFELVFHFAFVAIFIEYFESESLGYRKYVLEYLREEMSILSF